MSRKLPTFQPVTSPIVQELAELGLLVRNQRAQLGLRIDDAAALCGVSSDVFSRLENGKPVTTNKLMLILNGFGMRLIALPI
jgi:transcriptional regulator with XRE-family HTH domain